MNPKTQARQRRAKKSRVHMRTAGSVRLSVHRTPRPIYAQGISGDSKTVLAKAVGEVAKKWKAPSTCNNKTLKLAWLLNYTCDLGEEE